MNTPSPRQVAHRLNRFRAIAQAKASVAPARSGFWEKFMFYARGGYDTPTGPVFPAQYRQSSPAAAQAAAQDVKPLTPKSVGAFLLMPQINLSLKSLGFAWVLLVQLMAGIFASNGLIAADHPATTYRGASNTRLIDLFSIARSGFRFNLQDSRKALVWLSMVGFIMVVAGLLLTTIAKLSFGVSHAYAQMSTTDFQDGKDLGSKLIDSFFGLGAYAGPKTPALNNMISTFNQMVLILGGIILLLTIVSVVAETARSGVPFGKNFNPVWAPIRLIIAIAFMVPLTNGLSSGQNILIDLVKWSSGFATTNVWGKFSDQVLNGENSITPALRDTASEGNSVLMEYERLALLEANNADFCAKLQSTTATCPSGKMVTGDPNSSSLSSIKSGDYYLQPTLYVMPNGSTTTKVTMTNNSGQVVTPNTMTINLVYPALKAKGDPVTSGAPGERDNSLERGQAILGAVAINAYNKKVYDELMKHKGQPAPANLDGISGIASDPEAYALVMNYKSFMEAQSAIRTAQLPQKTVAILDSAEYDWQEEYYYNPDVFGNVSDVLNKLTAPAPNGLMKSYEKNRDNNVAAAVGVLKTAISNSLTSGGNINKQLNAFGWVGAPVFINQLGTVNSDFQDALRAVPRVNFSQLHPPEMFSKVDDVAYNLSQYATTGTMPDKAWSQDSRAAQGKNVNQMFNSFTNAMDPNSTNKLSGLDTIKIIFASAIYDVSNPSCVNAGICEMSQNPLVNLASVGKFVTQALISTMYRDADFKPSGSDLTVAQSLQNETTRVCQNVSSGAFTQAQCNQLQANLNDKLNALGKGDNGKNGINATPFMLTFLTYGFMMGFFLPFLPLFRFMLGFLGWLMLLFEAILAVPLLGLAHLRTDGDGIMGPMAQGGYLMILGLLIKPVLMVVGLIAGLVLFNAIIQVIAYVFQPLMFMETNTIFFGMYMLLFASFVSVVANSAFKMIDIIPSSVISWIGGRLENKTDDAMTVQSQALGTVQSLGSSIVFAGRTQATGDAGGPLAMPQSQGAVQTDGGRQPNAVRGSSLLGSGVGGGATMLAQNNTSPAIGPSSAASSSDSNLGSISKNIRQAGSSGGTGGIVS